MAQEHILMLLIQAGAHILIIHLMEPLTDLYQSFPVQPMHWYGLLYTEEITMIEFMQLFWTIMIIYICLGNHNQVPLLLREIPSE